MQRETRFVIIRHGSRRDEYVQSIDTVSGRPSWTEERESAKTWRHHSDAALLAFGIGHVGSISVPVAR